MKYLIYLALFAIAFGNLSSLEPELVSPADVKLDWYLYVDNDNIYTIGSVVKNENDIWVLNKSSKKMEKLTDFQERTNIEFIGTVINRMLFFISNQSGTVKFLSTNGTKEGTNIDVEIDNISYYYYNINGLRSRSNSIKYNDKFYFNLQNRITGRAETWVTDGTKEGTSNLNDTNNIHYVKSFNVLSNKLIALIVDYKNGHKNKLYEIKADGTKTKLAEFEEKFYELRSDEKYIFFLNDSNNEDTIGLWVTDGTKEGTDHLTRGVGRIKFYEQAKDFYRKFGNNYAFIAEYQGGHRLSIDDLFIFNESMGNIHYLSEIVNKGQIYNIEFIDILNEKLFFNFRTKDSKEIWVTDGTSEGTFQITSLSIDDEVISKYGSVVINEKLLMIIKINNEYYLIETNGEIGNVFYRVNISQEFEFETNSISLSNIQFENKVFLTQNNLYLYSLDLSTDKLIYIQPIYLNGKPFFEKYGNQLYLTALYSPYFSSPQRHYYNEFRNIFEAIKPKDASSSKHGPISPLIDDYLYFSANYYNNGYKLYRIDNTFQTVSNVETQPTDELNLYPNPTGDFLNISVDEPTSVSIIDLTGKVVMSIESYSSGGISTSDLPTGVYNIILDENTYGGKFVKE